MTDIARTPSLDLIESLERDERPTERIATALESLAQTAVKWYDKLYPERKPQDATVTHIPNTEERLREDQGASDEPLEEWLGPRELEVLGRAQGAGSAERSAAPTEGDGRRPSQKS